MKNTVFYDKHIEKGAKMLPFAGYMMPVQYEGINLEHKHVRNEIGVFDVSHMGQIYVSGTKAADFLQKLTSNDINSLYDGRAQYTLLMNEESGIIDDMIVYRISEEIFLIVINAANIDKDYNWFVKNNSEKLTIENKSEERFILSIQGPKALNFAQKFIDKDILEMKSYHFVETKFEKKYDIIVSTTGYTGSGGVEIYGKNTDALAIWDKLFAYETADNIKPIGLAARDTLRLEKGYSLYGNDIDETTTPIEAGLGWVTKTNKDFIGKEKILLQKENGCDRKLIAFKLKDRGIPRKGYEIYSLEKEKIGIVTSGTLSPTTKEAIGLGYVKTNFSKKNTVILIKIRDQWIESEIVALPFV